MAEDGMLLNFDTSFTVFTAKTKLRGGRWKDRLSARKGVGSGRRRVGGQDEGNANFIQLGPRQTKDLQKGLSSEDRHAAKRQRLSDPEHQGASRIQTSSREKEVVSSLFTFNPKSKSVENAEEKGEVPDLKPSNAPLPPGATNFTSLGISATLATHLLTKLELNAPTAIQKATLPQLLKEDADAFLQAETGSGKTLAYLLPIVQRLMALSGAKDGHVHRDSGLFAIIIAPTRELCRQIQSVLDSLLRCAHWLVAGSVTGGERKKSEKARLRKGLNILVATPGRLADHLQNTTVLDVANVRWLVLDEGDRLMELGFEQEIKTVVEALEKHGSRSNGGQTVAGKGSLEGLPQRRVTVLCSATMKMTVQRLGEVSLKDAIHIRAGGQDSDNRDDPASTRFMAPAQMKQSYMIVPAKQRLVTLAALLRKTFARRGSVMKAIVFFSCADSVDFHFEIFRRGADAANSSPDSAEPQQVASPPTSSPEPVKTKQRKQHFNIIDLTSGPITFSTTPLITSPLNPNLSIYRLHGSLAQPVRTSTLHAFSNTKDPAILMCTDVASRGLDLPSIDLVIEYDPAFSADDHLHRVGRTARAGKEGRAVLFLMPGSEERYVELLEKEGHNVEGTKRRLGRIDVEDTLKSGFAENLQAKKIQESKTSKASHSRGASFVPSAGGNSRWEQVATDWQLEAERWTLPTENRRGHDLAEKAFKSSVAAYATHTKAERYMFDVADLHLGHLAKAFALRDKPSSFGRGSAMPKKRDRSGKITKDSKQRGDFVDGSDDDKSQRTAAIDADIVAKMKLLAKAKEADRAGEFNFG